MDTLTTPFSKWLITAALTIYSVSLGLYILHFGGYGFSGDTGVWGEFGDFMGGAVNPILGMITIWFLAVTLRHSEQSHNEQVYLSVEMRDFEACIALMSYYEKNAIDLISVVDAKREKLKVNNESSKMIDSDVTAHIKEIEDKAQVFLDLSNELKPMLENVEYTNQGLRYKS